MLPAKPSDDDELKFGWQYATSIEDCPKNVPDRYRRAHGKFFLYARPSTARPWAPVLRFERVSELAVDAIYTGLTHTAAAFDSLDAARRVMRSVLPRLLLLHPGAGMMIQYMEWGSFGSDEKPGFESKLVVE